MTNDEAILILQNDAYVLYEDDSPYDRQAYTLAVKALEAQKWIPVTERLPKTSEDVIVFAYGNMIRIWSLERMHYTTADVYWECEDGSNEEVDVVTHWMPLPEPPKDGE